MLQPILSTDLSNVKASMHRIDQASLPLRLEIILATNDRGMQGFQFDSPLQRDAAPSNRPAAANNPKSRTAQPL